MSKGPEAKVKDKIKKVLKQAGAYYCMPAAGPYGQQGVPDILGCYRGAFFAIEAKAPGKKYRVSANQQNHLDSINGADGWGIVADCEEDAIQMLKEIDDAG